MTILEALRDPHVFGAHFGGDSWASWRTFLAAAFGLPLVAPGMPGDTLERFHWHTGRPLAPLHPVPREAWVVAGRRAGKSRIAALIAVYLAAFRDYSHVLAPGERGTLPIIAADRRQARTVLRYVMGLLEGCPMLADLVVNRTAESVELATRVVIEVHTASFRTVRGYTVVAAVLDEVAYWRTEDSANPDREILAALRPAMATVPGALLVAISSPYARRGVLWDAYERHYAQEDDPVLVWRADTASMNPTVDPAILATAYEQDEAAASAEYGAEFRRDIEAFIAKEVLEACTMPDRHELPPLGQVRHVAFTDPSGGSADAWTLAIAHAERRGTQWVAVLDCVREMRPPFSPDAVVADFAALLKQYRVAAVMGDRYGGEFPRELFAKHGIKYEPAERTKSEIYLEVLPVLNAHRIELLDVRRLAAQLLGLERRTSRGGRDTVDHAPRAHDDVANAAAGALLLAADGPGTAIPEAEGLATTPYRAVDWERELRRVGGVLPPGAIRREFGDGGEGW